MQPQFILNIIEAPVVTAFQAFRVVIFGGDSYACGGVVSCEDALDARQARILIPALACRFR